MGRINLKQIEDRIKNFQQDSPSEVIVGKDVAPKKELISIQINICVSRKRLLKIVTSVDTSLETKETSEDEQESIYFFYKDEPTPPSRSKKDIIQIRKAKNHLIGGYYNILKYCDEWQLIDEHTYLLLQKCVYNFEKRITASSINKEDIEELKKDIDTPLFDFIASVIYRYEKFQPLLKEQQQEILRQVQKLQQTAEVDETVYESEILYHVLCAYNIGSIENRKKLQQLSTNICDTNVNVFRKQILEIVQSPIIEACS